MRHPSFRGGEQGGHHSRRAARVVRSPAQIIEAPALTPVQQAFIDEQAIQCGYCYNGMTIKACELLSKTPRPSEAQIRAAMNGHLCRCGTYPRIIKAIQRAAQAAVAEGTQEQHQ